MSRTLIVDASPLILLTRIGHADLLVAIAEHVIVPMAVLRELDAGAARDQAAEWVRHSATVTVVEDVPVPPDIAAEDLGAGESQVLAHAHWTVHAEAVLDDRAARRCAGTLGIPMLGTLAIVVSARQRGLIPSLRPVLDDLAVNGMRLTAELRSAALTIAGESTD